MELAGLSVVEGIGEEASVLVCFSLADARVVTVTFTEVNVGGATLSSMLLPTASLEVALVCITAGNSVIKPPPNPVVPTVLPNVEASVTSDSLCSVTVGMLTVDGMLRVSISAVPSTSWPLAWNVSSLGEGDGALTEAGEVAAARKIKKKERSIAGGLAIPRYCVLRSAGGLARPRAILPIFTVTRVYSR